MDWVMASLQQRGIVFFWFDSRTTAQTGALPLRLQGWRNLFGGNVFLDNPA